MHQIVDTLVIGARQTGFAAGYQLQRAGRSFTILDAAAQSQTEDLRPFFIFCVYLSVHIRGPRHTTQK
jgi:cation diffusion facilitator CzcD-associated flavoprotein CzcO